MKRALITGATGLIGRQLLRLLLEDTAYDRIIALSRKPIEVTSGKLEVIVMDFEDIDQLNVEVDDVFCCLGTTMKKSGTREAFRKVDYDYVVGIAQQSLRTGAKRFFLISALGADKNSRIFYNQVKGEVEETVSAMEFRAVYIFRPSLLLGERTESRSGEDAAKAFFKLFGFLIPEKYKAIADTQVAKAMLAMAQRNDTGVHILESTNMRKY